MADEKKPDANSSSDQDMRRLSDETQPGVENNNTGADGAKSAGGGESELAEQLAKVRNEFLYLYAEFENYKKNAIKERSDLRKYGSERLVVDLLGVLDIFETALSLEPTPENMAAFRKGIELTGQELRSTLVKHGVEEQVALGSAFNPTMHEALSSEETSEFPEGHISRVFKKPYKLHDRIVRPGQVVVARPKSN
ncbi:MAG: nucleotide exchange factor GrpE [Bdellovibrionales bacterium]|nr:nucleotide exchange factor GrpE [Bdellovibrionales bacterium]